MSHNPVGLKSIEKVVNLNTDMHKEENGMWRQRHTEKTPCDNSGREGRSTSQGEPRIDRTTPEARKRQEWILPKVSEEHDPADTLISDF